MTLTRWRLFAIFVACTWPWFWAGAQNTQPAIPVPQLDPGMLGQPGFRFADSVPTAVNLISHGAGARNGHVWIGDTGKSLRILGEVDGSAPEWPQSKNEILSKDHIEVWLAAGVDVPMDAIGWGDDFDDTKLANDDECKGMRDADGDDIEAVCREWFNAQQDYRVALKRLFVRQWLVGGNFSVESYATSAYAAMSTKYSRHGLEVLKPHGAIQFRSELRSGNSGYRFEIDLPHTSFPPLNSLTISELRLMVDVFSAAPTGRREGSFSTTAAERAYGRPDSFNVLQMEPALSFDVTPCHSKLEGRGEWQWRGMFPAWFIPNEPSGASYQRDGFVLANEIRIDRGGPRDDIVSPAVIPTHYFWHALGATEWVCGPELAYRHDGTIRDLGLNIETYNGDRNVAEDGFDARRDSNGTVLIKVGPRVWNAGSNAQCGACPHMEMDIIGLDKNLNPATLLKIDDRIGGPSEPSSGDIAISPDWSHVVEYEESGDDENHLTWHSVTYCSDVSYAVCDRKSDVQPPNPPVLRKLLE